MSDRGTSERTFMYKIVGADGKEYGPVPADLLLQWIAEGRANALTKVLVEGSLEWRPLSAIPEFEAALAAKAAAPPLFPTAPVTTPADAEAMAYEILARGYYLDIGRCIGR